MSAPRSTKVDVHGWVILDKPVGMTSTQGVAVVKRVFNAKKAGHAGTLDPLASGLLPIALGEATKTVPYVMDGRKVYRFTVQWGVETTTDDTEGTPVATSELRPSRAAVEALLPRYTGVISQVPPQFSAIKINGERAYDLARDGEAVALEAREIEIHRLVLVEATADTTVFEAECGKGTYVRALARDLGRDLGCHGHVVALRRTVVGAFDEQDAVTPDELRAMKEGGEGLLPIEDALLPVETALESLPSVTVSRHDAGRLARGQSVILRGRDAPIFDGTAAIMAGGTLVALADFERGELVPKRIFHLGGPE
ncbi:tRNA pseudouridine(55) synthase TruB [Labrys wisconsinensis]|uniref:tRNA pseudouridine synthase B n=1 Tax=Labrys wisconsinensis TaxID=425677 RepID=A0ABU0JG33_9HYPH|nr:tRNA pseudouridine(55) synthase TruB [Labrys wisconsinensis]MDQ0472530.1 tRNA pseudouridine55 synthase [Labrys wisconsinensis]